MILRGHHGSGGLSPGSGTHARDYGATIRVRRAGAPVRHGRQSNNFATGLARKRKFNRGLLAAALCVALPATSAFAIGATPLSKDAFERGLSTPAARADGLYRPDGVVDTTCRPGLRRGACRAGRHGARIHCRPQRATGGSAPTPRHRMCAIHLREGNGFSVVHFE